MVRFNLSLLLLGAISYPNLAEAISPATLPKPPENKICVNGRETKPAPESGTCGIGFWGPYVEQEFVNNCFVGGKWGTDSKNKSTCGYLSSAPKNFKPTVVKTQTENVVVEPTVTAEKENVTENGTGATKKVESPGSGVGGGSSQGAITRHNELVQRVESADELVQQEKAQLKQARKDYRGEKRAHAATGVRLEQARTDNEVQGTVQNLQKKFDDDGKALEKQKNAITGKGGNKERLKAARVARRDAKKAEREQRDDYEAAKAVDDIKEEHEGAYGGNYGGEDVGTSAAITQASSQVSNTTDAVSGHKVQMAAQDREASLRQQGSMNTNLEQINEARRETADDAKKALTTGGILDMALGAFQAFRAEEHFRSMGDVNEAATTANKQIHKSYKDKVDAIKAKGVTETQAKELEDAKKEYETQLGTVTTNRGEENKSQTNAGVAQSVAAAGMIYQGVQKFQQAAAINAIEAQMGGNPHQYGFAMGGGITQGGAQDGMNNLSPVQSAVTTEEEGKKDDLAQNSNINPNDPNLVPNGPAAAPFEYKDPGAGGGGGGGGPGMAGGTSADKGAMEAGAQGPAASLKAGSYAAVAGGGGYKSKNSGGAGKAGVDTAFSDLLKKFLPGAEPEKKKAPGELQFGDRSPASSQTAVIGRNKNIFEEISKRYQKKSAEGSVF